MTQAQWESLALTVLKIVGGTTAGAALLAKLGLDPSQYPAIITAVGGLIAAAATVWSLFSHSEKNTVAAAAAMPNVAAIATTNTAAGKALADAVPSELVQPAGSAKAADLVGASRPK